MPGSCRRSCSLRATRRSRSTSRTSCTSSRAGRCSRRRHESPCESSSEADLAGDRSGLPRRAGSGIPAGAASAGAPGGGRGNARWRSSTAWSPAHGSRKSCWLPVTTWRRPGRTPWSRTSFRPVRLERHGIKTISMAGHPEGHPKVSLDEIRRAERRESHARDAGRPGCQPRDPVLFRAHAVPGMGRRPARPRRPGALRRRCGGPGSPCDLAQVRDALRGRPLDSGIDRTTVLFHAPAGRSRTGTR